uniref:Uncharacterized protein n=1 Tax=Arundo donax TaxID=35708 RepID=A0A0A9DVU8_ARUDO
MLTSSCATPLQKFELVGGSCVERFDSSVPSRCSKPSNVFLSRTSQVASTLVWPASHCKSSTAVLDLLRASSGPWRRILPPPHHAAPTACSRGYRARACPAASLFNSLIARMVDTVALMLAAGVAPTAFTFAPILSSLFLSAPCDA